MTPLATLRALPLAVLPLVAGCQTMSDPTTAALIDCAASNQVAWDQFEAYSDQMAESGIQVNMGIAQSLPINQAIKSRELLLERPEFQSGDPAINRLHPTKNKELEKAIDTRKPIWAAVGKKKLVKQNMNCNRILYK